MKKYKLLALGCALLLGMSCCLTGCTTPEKTGDTSKKQTEQQEEIKKAETQDINDVHLRDKDSLYENDDETSVVTMYLTVSRGNSSEGTDHTWKEINSYSAYDYDKMGVDRYQTAALFRLVMSQVRRAGRLDMVKMCRMLPCRSEDRHRAVIRRKTIRLS